jgi:ribosomal protein S18 acetylase RimI-like enzyme
MLDDVSVRRARATDLPPIASLAARLVEMHHRTDPDRFLLVDNVAKGYSRWFERELARTDAVILVAVRGDTVIGYAYGTSEGRDWNLLLDAHGAIHDVFVDETVRRAGVGRKLLEAMLHELEGLGAPCIVLSTMIGNEAAQRLFRACGFRATMLEMTRSSRCTNG